MRVLVLGAAVSGLAAARLATRLGHGVSVYDARPDAAGSIIELGFSAAVGPWDPGLLDGVDLVVASPGFPERSAPITDAYEAGVAVESEIEFAWRHLDGPRTVAVTGTNGKTTVTGLIASMLQRAGFRAPAVGNIGDPLADAVGRQLDVVVVEVSSFQLQLTHQFRPDVAVVTNVAEDHLDWHGSVQAYEAAKAKIVANQTPDDVIVFPTNDPGAVRVASGGRGRMVEVAVDRVEGGFGVGDGSVWFGGSAVARTEVAVDDGPFMVDLLLAGAASMAAGADADAVIAVAREFTAGPHRRTEVADVGGIRYIDDSKATNPHAALAAIDSFDSVVLIAGGQAKGLDIAALVTRPNVRAAVVMGESAELLRQAAPETTMVVGSMAEAVERAHELARPGDVVLLSPGGASYDMFRSYAHRGDEFAVSVRTLLEGVAS